MTNKELSTAIRNNLKAAGYSVRDNFSIRVQDSGYSTRVDVTVKNPIIDLDAVRAILDKYEDIRRDACGEILCGANTYVFVRPADGLYLAPARKYAADAADALCKATDSARTDACIYRAGDRLICSYFENGVVHLAGYQDMGPYLKDCGRTRITPAEIDSMAVAIYKLNTFGKIA